MNINSTFKEEVTENLPEEVKEDGAVITGATTAGAVIGSCICPGAGTAIGAGVGAIAGGIAVIVKTINENT